MGTCRGAMNCALQSTVRMETRLISNLVSSCLCGKQDCRVACFRKVVKPLISRNSQDKNYFIFHFSDIKYQYLIENDCRSGGAICRWNSGKADNFTCIHTTTKSYHTIR